MPSRLSRRQLTRSEEGGRNGNVGGVSYRSASGIRSAARKCPRLSGRQTVRFREPKAGKLPFSLASSEGPLTPTRRHMNQRPYSWNDGSLDNSNLRSSRVRGVGGTPSANKLAWKSGHSPDVRTRRRPVRFHPDRVARIFDGESFDSSHCGAYDRGRWFSEILAACQSDAGRRLRRQLGSVRP